jgi:hypothetical protein
VTADPTRTIDPEPGPADPGPADPGPADPGPAEPAATGPGPAATEVTESGLADPGGPESATGRAGQDPNDPAAAVFRVPALAVLGVVLLAVCVTPVAFALPGLQLVYLVPVAVAAWVLRRRTVADTDGIRVRYLVGGRTLRWAELAGLLLRDRSVTRAVRTDGGHVTLPCVRYRDLPRLATASGGRLTLPRPDDTEQPAEADRHGTDSGSPAE